jgi:hypothetical protein
MTLQVLTDVPSPNVADVQIDAEGEVPTVSFAADPHGGPEACWFAFRIACDESAGPVRLVLKHATNLLGASPAESVRPVIRHADADRDGPEEGWTRLDGAKRVELDDGRLWYEWTLQRVYPSVEVAACYPYGPAEMDELIQQTGGYWRSDAVGLSQGGRPLVRLSNDPGSNDPEQRKAGLYLLARQHAGETPGGWVLDGFLRRLADQGRDDLLVWAVPLANVDGVVQGDYGKDNFPYDLNRAWGNPPMRHETLVMQRDASLWARRSRPACLIDFHAPGLADTQGVYAFGLDYEDPLRAERYSRYVQAMHASLGELARAEGEFDRRARYASRWSTPWSAQYARSRGQVGFSIEVPYQAAGETVFTRALYRQAGARMADAVADVAVEEA